MTSLRPKLSIVTICLNDKEGLKKTIQSVLSQTFENYEYLVIDGKSTDGSYEVIQSYQHRLTYWISEKDTGRYNAMNKGIAKAKGEYCLFLNSGDYLADDTVLTQVFAGNLAADIVYGDLVYLHKEGTQQLYRQPPKISLDHLMRETILHPASFIKRSLFELYGTYDESFEIAADYAFFIKTVLKHQVSTFYVPFVISIFNMEGISSNTRYLALIESERKRAQKCYLPLLIYEFYYELVPLIHSRDYSTFVKIKKVPFLNFIQKGVYKILNKFFL